MHFKGITITKIDDVVRTDEDDVIQKFVEAYPNVTGANKLLYDLTYANRCTPFARVAFNAIDSLIGNYWCDNQIEFEDQTDEVRESYHNDRIYTVKLPNGTIKKVQHVFSIGGNLFDIANGIIRQYRSCRGIRHPYVNPLFRSHKASKMTIINDQPASDVYKFIYYGENILEYDYDVEMKAFGFWYNPNAIYSSYSIGDRDGMIGLLPVKEDCTEYIISSLDLNDAIVEVDGVKYRLVAGARVKDICFDAIDKIFSDVNRWWKFDYLLPSEPITKDKSNDLDILNDMIVQNPNPSSLKSFLEHSDPNDVVAILDLKC